MYKFDFIATRQDKTYSMRDHFAGVTERTFDVSYVSWGISELRGRI